MFSDTSTGTCNRTLWTAMAQRDQVLVGRESLFWLPVCTFLARCKSTNGPFLSERGTLTFSSLTVVCSCDAEQSCRQCACCGASSCLWSAGPKGLPGADYLVRTCLRRRRAGDRPDSSQRRAPS